MSTPNDEVVYKKRKMVINEMVGTENDYLSNIMTLRIMYLVPIIDLLERDPEIVPDTLRRALLAIPSDLDAIIGIHKEFLPNLIGSTRNVTNDTRVAEYFLSHAISLPIYFSYLNHYQNLLPLLTKERTTAFGDHLERMKKPQCRGKGIRDFLIMPAQRIPRYLMLLTDLVKKTPEDHVDYQQLLAAKDCYAALADKVETHLDKLKAVEKIMTVSASLVFKKKERDFVLIKPHRKLLGELDVEYLLDEADTKVESHLFFFNDLLLFCSSPDKNEMRHVMFIQLLDGIIFEQHKVSGTQAVAFRQSDELATYFLTVWANSQSADFLFNGLSGANVQRVNTVPIMTRNKASPRTKVPDLRSLPRSSSAFDLNRIKPKARMKLAHNTSEKNQLPPVLSPRDSDTIFQEPEIPLRKPKQRAKTTSGSTSKHRKSKKRSKKYSPQCEIPQTL